MSGEQRLYRRHETPSGPVPAAEPWYGLPPDLLEAAPRRLAYASLMYGGAYAVQYVVVQWAITMGAPVTEDMNTDPFSVITLVFVLLALGVWALARSKVLSGRRIVDLSLVSGVVGTLGIEIGVLWMPRSMSIDMLTTLDWGAVWIIIFPLIIPTTPGRTLVATLLAASLRPIMGLILVAKGFPAPTLGTFVLIAFPNYICATLATIGSRLVYGLGRDVSRARRLGSYRLVERMSNGGMGEVWHAEHGLLARPAAVKLIRPETLGHADPEARQTLLRRFEREAMATASLSSPHTVELYDFGVSEDGAFYYVMELLRGVDLDQLVKRFGPVPAPRVAFLLIQACDSLAEAHHAGLVHRDIKPANLFVCRRGMAHDFLKVLDFGLVKAASDASGEESALTRQGAAAGTPAFMAPEVGLGEADVDGRADIYALGCLAYWLLTGALVFERDTPMQLALAHVQAEVTAPSRRSSLAIPPSLEQLVMRCLEKDRARRPQSAAELATLLGDLRLEPRWGADTAAAWWRANLPDLAV